MIALIIKKIKNHSFPRSAKLALRGLPKAGAARSLIDKSRSRSASLCETSKRSAAPSASRAFFDALRVRGARLSTQLV